MYIYIYVCMYAFKQLNSESKDFFEISNTVVKFSLEKVTEYDFWKNVPHSPKWVTFSPFWA